MRTIRRFGTKVKKVLRGRWFKRLAIYPSILAISFAGGYFARTGTDTRMVVVDPQPIPAKFDTKSMRDAVPQKNLRNIAGQNRSSQPQAASSALNSQGTAIAPVPVRGPAVHSSQQQNSLGGGSLGESARNRDHSPTTFSPPASTTNGYVPSAQIVYSENPSQQQALANYGKKYLESNSPEERLKVQKEMIDLIVGSFDSTQAGERAKIEAFEKRLAVWKRAVEKREKMKREVVEGYLAQTLGIPNPTSWYFSGESVMNSLSAFPDQESLESYWGQAENNKLETLKDDIDATSVPQLEQQQPRLSPEPAVTY